MASLNVKKFMLLEERDGIVEELKELRERCREGEHEAAEEAMYGITKLAESGKDKPSLMATIISILISGFEAVDSEWLEQNGNH